MNSSTRRVSVIAWTVRGHKEDPAGHHLPAGKSVATDWHGYAFFICTEDNRILLPIYRVFPKWWIDPVS